MLASKEKAIAFVSFSKIIKIQINFVCRLYLHHTLHSSYLSLRCFVCFREDEVELTDQHQYEDNQPGDEDAFAREPLILRFYCPTTVAKDLVLIPVHTQPNDAEKELDELHDVVKTMRKKWKSPNIMVLGDFNAAGSYLSKKKKKVIRISSPPFYWLIDDTVDTTTHSNKHAYDRIVVYTKKMQNTIVPNSAKPFNFQREFRLNKTVALSVSDHYPVEVELKTAVRRRKKATCSVGYWFDSRLTCGSGQRAWWHCCMAASPRAAVATIQ
uniref:Deoxyribonuclease 1 like 4, tandem duplicate 2 n=1 Tax=Poecilia latipinna TaxID=48699 RepID=A0A3B3U0R5_9TELE